MGLSKDYEVSCQELDFLANTATGIPGVVGTRMMGGGFGGCTINIVESESVEKFKEQIQEAYHTKYGKTPEVYTTQIEDGVTVL